ncbi:MAG TPA: hypothetical protein VFI28_02200 [Candidatus Limnocylindrales bacterium]|nr:hypothetical protein [Candidatus Limnocylindrales bacterium]
MSVALAVAVLLAMAAAGVVAIGACLPFLTRAERIGYGAPIGMVVASDAILVVSDVQGALTLPTVIGATILVLLVAAGLRRRLPTTEPTEPIEPAEPAEPRPPRPPRNLRASIRDWLPRDAGTWLAFAIVAAFALRWALFWPNAVDVRPDGIYATHVNVWGDWPVHMGIVSSFVDGNNFPPTHPRFAGHAFGYHYLSDLTAAGLVPFGLSAAGALELHSLVLSVVAAIALFGFARALTGSPTAGALTVGLFLLGGGLGWINTIQGLLGNDANLPQPVTLPWDYRWKTESNFQWVNMFWGFWMSQRAFLYGMPMAFAIVRTTLRARETGSMRLWVVAGVIAGLLPLAHLATLLSLAIVVPVLFFLLPSRGWILFGVVWVVVAAPQLLMLGGGGAGALASLRVQLGWVSAAEPSPDAWPIFWIKNQGAFLVLGVLPLIVARIVPPVTRRVLLAFWAIWVAGNILVFQPWDWDNHKILVYWFLAVAIGSAAALVWLWQRWRGPLLRAGLALAVVSMIASGVLEDATQALGESTYRMLDAEQVDLAAQIVARTPPHAVFQDAMDNHDSVQMLAGRTLYVGYPNWLWTEGVPYTGRQQVATKILRWTADAPQLLASSGIDFVVIGPKERTELGANEDAFRQRFPIVAQTASYRVYDVRTAHG